jgi:mono/diheme cytochrome c family protein
MRTWAYLATLAAVVSIGTPPKAAAQEAQMKSSFQPNAESAARGRKLFTAKGCQACHSIGQGKMAGPDLKGVTERAPVDWIRTFLKNPREQFNNQDGRTVALVQAAHGAVMPNFKLREDEIDELINYLALAQKR